jgi:hypothetical protein
MTWSDKIALPTDEYGEFALMRVGAHGKVYIASMTHDQTQGGTGFYVSSDGGNTWDVHDVATFTGFPVGNIQRTQLKGDNGFRSLAYISFDVDPATNKLMAAYSTYETNDTDQNSYAALYTVTSTDDGATWGDSTEVGSLNRLEEDHFQPWVACDAVTGKTYLSFYSSEEDTLNNILSRAARVDFNQPHNLNLLGGEKFNPLTIDAPSPFIGDYTGSDFYNNTYAAVWTEPRLKNKVAQKDGDIYVYVEYPDSNVTLSSGVRLVEVGSFNVQPVQNPCADGMLKLTVSTNLEATVSARLYDERGTLVGAAQAMGGINPELTLSMDVHSLPAGTYHAYVTNGSKSQEQNIVVLH